MSPKKPTTKKTIVKEKYKIDRAGNRSLVCQHLIEKKPKGVFKQCMQQALTSVESKEYFKYCRYHIELYPKEYAKYIKDLVAKGEGLTESEVDALYKKLYYKNSFVYTKDFWQKLEVDQVKLHLDKRQLTGLLEEIKALNGLIELYVKGITKRQIIQKPHVLAGLLERLGKLKEQQAKILHGQSQSIHISALHFALDRIFQSVDKHFGRLENNESAYLAFEQDMRELSEYLKTANVLSGKPIRKTE